MKNGKIFKCRDGYFEDAELKCKQCNIKCLTCFGVTDNECKSCEKSKRILNGTCVC